MDFLKTRTVYRSPRNSANNESESITDILNHLKSNKKTRYSYDIIDTSGFWIFKKLYLYRSGENPYKEGQAIDILGEKFTVGKIKKTKDGHKIRLIQN